MNALNVLSLVAVAAVCSSAQLVAYPGLLGGYPGILRAYPGLVQAAPVTFRSVATKPITLKTVAPAPVTLKTVVPGPISYNAVAPVPTTVQAVAPVAPVSPVLSQYHSQDELGQYSFGYSGGPSSRAETRDAFGVVRGSYNYVDADGKVQTQHYVADALGFRVAATNLPVAPATADSVGPDPVQDTPEVAEAKAAFKSAYDEAAAAAAAAPDSRKKRSLAVAPTFTPYSPLRFAYGFSAPLTYSHNSVVGSPLTYTVAYPSAGTYSAAPVATTYTAAATAAVRDAELLRVVHNPGHAVSYRVY